MRHIAHLPTGQTFYNDSEPETPFTFIVVGNRSEAHERPEIEPQKIATGKLSDEEKIQRVAHVHNMSAGRFKLKPLAWCHSEEEAESAAQNYPPPVWENVKVRIVDTVVP